MGLFLGFFLLFVGAYGLLGIALIIGAIAMFIAGNKRYKHCKDDKGHKLGIVLYVAGTFSAILGLIVIIFDLYIIKLFF